MAGRAHALDQARIPEARVLGLGMVEVVGLGAGRELADPTHRVALAHVGRQPSPPSRAVDRARHPGEAVVAAAVLGATARALDDVWAVRLGTQVRRRHAGMLGVASHGGHGFVPNDLP
jgi:hypothetical protein